MEPAQALTEIAQTVDRATELANQMLALAKVEQLRQDHAVPQTDWSPVVRAVALDLSALVADRDLDFSLDLVTAAPVRAHEWALRELTRNLLHNAIKHSPRGGLLEVALRRDATTVALTVSDSGPGIAPALRDRLFQPFATDHREGPSLAGSGLGLAICREIVLSLGGQIDMHNRTEGSTTQGRDATARLPLHTPT